MPPFGPILEAEPLVIYAMVLLAVTLFVLYGMQAVVNLLRRQEAHLQRVLVQQLLIDISPRTGVALYWICVASFALLGYALMRDLVWMSAGALAGFIVPLVLLKHLEQRRRRRLDEQLVDGITTIASGVRAGLNLVQALEMLVRNSSGPIRQEMAQLLREYHLGLDLNQAMRNAANRIGSSLYRLLFTAIELHRVRGGDAGASLDRIAESIREIQRLEGKLDALTAQGRTQARMMGLMPAFLLGVLYTIDPEGVRLLFTEPLGRLLLLICTIMVISGFWWIRKIMQVDI